MSNNKFVIYSLFAVLIGLFAQGVASAQAPGPAPGSTKQVDVSIQDQLAKSQSYLTTMKSIRQRVRTMLAEARQQRDVVKTLCLNDKLNQLDVAIRSANERTRGLEAAAGQGDRDMCNHEFTILTVLFQRAEQLDAEALQCIGKEVGFVGESSVSMDVDPALPPDDDSDYPPDVTIIQPPTCASCFR